MRCQYCGREAQPGQVYCECGHPISLSGDNFSQPNPQPGFYQPGYQQQGFGSGFTPDGRSLASLQKKPGSGIGVKIVIVLVVIALLCGGGFLAYKLIKGQDVLDEDNWKKIDKSNYSITLPGAMKESDNIVELDPSYTREGFFQADDAAVYIGRMDLDADQQNIIKSNGLDKFKQAMLQAGSQRSINGQKLDPKMRGDLIVMEYSATRKNYLKNTDEVYILDAIYINEEVMYELEAYCPKADKDKYIDSMYKWVDSFKLK